MTTKEILEQIETEKVSAEYVLHQMLKLAMAITCEGYVSKDYTKFIEFEIGGVTVFSDPYYQTVQIDEQDLNQEQMLLLTKELKKRILAFDKKTRNARNNAAKEIFEKPLPDIDM